MVRIGRFRYKPTVSILFFAAGCFLAQAQKQPTVDDNMFSKNQVAISFADLRSTPHALSNRRFLMMSLLNGISYTRRFNKALSISVQAESALELTTTKCSQCPGFGADDFTRYNHALLGFVSFMPLTQGSKIVNPDVSFGWLVSHARESENTFDRSPFAFAFQGGFPDPINYRSSWHTGGLLKLGIAVLPTKNPLTFRVNTSFRYGYNLVSKNRRYKNSEPSIYRPEKRELGHFRQWNIINLDVGYRF